MTLRRRLAAVDWGHVAESLAGEGYASLGAVLTHDECRRITALYDRDRFRARVDMARHRFGRGEYKYFAYPLPRLIADLRRQLYPPLASIANDWFTTLRSDEPRFPPDLATFLQRCADGRQTRPTPLLLNYGTGDFNRLHQDSYGAVAFPLQAVAMLSARGRDYTGGEFLIVEQHPRAQSRGVAVSPQRGEILVFPNRWRPCRGARGSFRVSVRHGLSTVRSGRRLALGLIFHDAA